MRAEAKKHIYIIAIFTLLMTVVISSSLLFKSDAASTGDCVKIQIKVIRDTEGMDEDSIFPEVYEAAALLDLTGEYSRDRVIDTVISNRSLHWYAKKERKLSVNEQEYEEYIEQLVNDSKDAVEYPEIEAACEEYGVSFEDVLRGDKRTYERVLIVDKLYKEYQESFNSGDHSIDGTEYNDWSSYWSALKAMIMEEFNATDDYKIYLNGIEASLEIYEECGDGDFTNADIEDTVIYDDLSYKYDLNYGEEDQGINIWLIIGCVVVVILVVVAVLFRAKRRND